MKKISQKISEQKIGHNAMLVLAVMRRFSKSLFMHWRQFKRRPDHVTTTDFQSFLSEDHHCRAMRLVLANLPDFNSFMHCRWVGRLREQPGLCLGREVRYKEGVASAFSKLPAASRRGR